MTDDFRFAFRQLRKNPGFAAIAIVTLALGIGAAAAMFGLIQGVLLSPPPYADPDRVVLISPARSDGGPYRRGATIGQWMSWRQARSIEPPAIYRWTFNFLVLPDGSESMGGMVVTPELLPRPRAAADSRPRVRRRRVGPSERAAVGHHPRLRPLAAQVQRRSEHRRTHDSDEPHAGAGAGRRRDAPGHQIPPRPGRVERAQLRPQRARRFLVRHGPGRIAPGLWRRKRDHAAARRRDARRGADRDRGAVGGAGAGRSDASGDHRRRRAGAGRPQSRRPAFAGAALRIGGARLLHRVRQRRGPAPDARAAAASGVRDALGARRGPMAAVPPGADRKPRPRARRRRARRGTRHRHRQAAQGDCRTGGAACGCRPHRLAGLRLRVSCRARRCRRRWVAAGRPRLSSGSVPGAQGHADDRRPARAPACSAPSRRCRLC